MAKYELVSVPLSLEDLKPKGRPKSDDTIALEKAITEFAAGSEDVRGIKFDGDLKAFRTKVYNVIRGMGKINALGGVKVSPVISDQAPGMLVLSKSSAKASSAPVRRQTRTKRASKAG